MIYDRNSNLTLVGLMTGTSVDGIDAAVVSVEGSGVDARIRCHGFRCYKYPADVRERLLGLAAGGPVATAAEASAMNFVLGELLGQAVISCARDLEISLKNVHAVASHGQTIYHQGRPTERSPASTLQIGEASVIAEMTGLTVVSDFRTADIAAGGHGAPLVPYFDAVFLRHESIGRAAQNIGGIGNVTYLPPGFGLDGVVAFDTGPGNMLIDAAAAHFSGGRISLDVDGKIASHGRVDPALMSRLLEHPFYSERPPRSAGREQFGVRYLHQVLQWPEARDLKSEDVLTTLTALTAESIARSYSTFLPNDVREIVISGGGARNPALVSMIERATGLSTARFDDFGIPGDAKEAVAFALLASETLRGVPSNVPSATGAQHPAILGRITQGRVTRPS